MGDGGDIQEIGFNSQVQAGGRSIHVQTEVSARGPKIRTTVLDGGTILHSNAVVCEPDITVETCRVKAEALHNETIARLGRGEFSNA